MGMLGSCLVAKQGCGQGDVALISKQQADTEFQASASCPVSMAEDKITHCEMQAPGTH